MERAGQFVLSPGGWDSLADRGDGHNVTGLCDALRCAWLDCRIDLGGTVAAGESNVQQLCGADSNAGVGPGKGGSCATESNPACSDSPDVSRIGSADVQPILRGVPWQRRQGERSRGGG